MSRLSSGRLFNAELSVPKALYKACMGLNTPKLAFKSNLATLWAIQKDMGIDYTTLFLTAHITALNKFLNMQNGMTAEQIEFVALQLVNDDCYKWYNLAEYNVIFNRMKTSYYGNLYGRFDSSTFFEIMRKYDNERTQAIEQARIEEASEYKKPMKDVFDYVKLKHEASIEKERDREFYAKMEQERIEKSKRQYVEFTQQVKAIVDAEHIKDKNEYQKRFNEVWMELMIKGGQQ